MHSTARVGCRHGWGAQHTGDGVHSTLWKGCTCQGWGAQHARDGVLSQISNQQHPMSPEPHWWLLSCGGVGWE